MWITASAPMIMDIPTSMLSTIRMVESQRHYLTMNKGSPYFTPTAALTSLP